MGYKIFTAGLIWIITGGLLLSGVSFGYWVADVDVVGWPIVWGVYLGAIPVWIGVVLGVLLWSAAKTYERDGKL